MINSWGFPKSAFITEFDTIAVLDGVPSTERQTGAQTRDVLRRIVPPGVQVSYTRVDDPSAVCQAISSLRGSQTGVHLHIEGHGGKVGLEIGDARGSLSWSELAVHLRPLCFSTRLNLSLFVAACEGVHGMRALSLREHVPFVWMAGPKDPLLPIELEAMTEAFYGELLRSGDLRRCVEVAASTGVRSGSVAYPLHAALLIINGFRDYLLAESSDSAVEARVRRLLGPQRESVATELQWSNAKKMIVEDAPRHLREIWSRVWMWESVPGAELRFPFSENAVRQLIDQVRGV